jgi:hypothetical protein
VMVIIIMMPIAAAMAVMMIAMTVMAAPMIPMPVIRG